MSTILTAAFQTIQRDSAICFPMLGNLTINPPSYFTVFGFKIYFYGVIIALGFILGIVCCTRICARFGIKEDDMYDAILVIIPTAIIGARLYYVLFELDHYLANPSEIFVLRDGGLAIYGTVIAVFLMTFLYCRRKGIKLGAMTDLCVMGLMLGQAIGRWGNLFNGEAYGYPVQSAFWQFFPVAVQVDGVWHLATFFYESCWDLAGFIVLWRYRLRARRAGDVFFLYLLWYGAGRTIIEGLRTDSLMLGPIRVSQLLSLALCLCGLVHFRRGKQNGGGRCSLPEKK